MRLFEFSLKFIRLMFEVCTIDIDGKVCNSLLLKASCRLKKQNTSFVNIQLSKIGEAIELRRESIDAIIRRIFKMAGQAVFNKGKNRVVNAVDYIAINQKLV